MRADSKADDGHEREVHAAGEPAVSRPVDGGLHGVRLQPRGWSLGGGAQARVGPGLSRRQARRCATADDRRPRRLTAGRGDILWGYLALYGSLPLLYARATDP